MIEYWPSQSRKTLVQSKKSSEHHTDTKADSSPKLLQKFGSSRTEKIKQIFCVQVERKKSSIAAFSQWKTVKRKKKKSFLSSYVTNNIYKTTNNYSSIWKRLTTDSYSNNLDIDEESTVFKKISLNYCTFFFFFLICTLNILIFIMF